MRFTTYSVRIFPIELKKCKHLNFLCKSVDWFLYDKNLRHEKVQKDQSNLRTHRPVSILPSLSKIYKKKKIKKMHDQMCTTQRIQVWEYEFSLTRILPYKENAVVL